MHNALLVFHRWLALITGLLLILVALSGAVLVFEGPVANAGAVHVVPGEVETNLTATEFELKTTCRLLSAERLRATGLNCN